MKVLLVEDSCNLRLLLTAELVELGEHSVDAAGTYHDAVLLLSRNSYEAIVTDFDLGGGPTGIDVLQHARRESPTVPVILHSGAVTEDSEQLFKALGFTDLVQKGSSVQLLLNALQRIVS